MNKLEQAARHYMSVFGQALEAHGIPFSKDQLNADAALREALMESNISEHKLEQQAEQEPVAWIEVERGIPMFARFADKYKPTGDGFIPLYTHPIRTKDLTDAFINELHKDAQDPISFARDVIAADREKNNANNNT